MGRFLVFLTILLDVTAAALTCAFGAVIVPNILWLGLYAVDVLARFVEYLFGGLTFLPRVAVMTFPTLFVWDTWHKTWGLIWLGLYLCARLSYLLKSPMLRWNAPANTAHVREGRWDLLAACITLYEQQLARFYPVPVKPFRVPPVIQYDERADASLIIWSRGLPVVPLGLLTPETQPLLRPLLALELAKYNGSDRTIQAIMATYPNPWPNGSLSFVLIWLWLPTLVRHTQTWKRWCFRRELAYDTFAYLCGQGELLLSILKTQESYNLQRLPNEFEPSTRERIGHLESLLNKEHEQMKERKLTVPTLPGALPVPLASFLLPHNQPLELEAPQEGHKVKQNQKETPLFDSLFGTS